MNDTQIKIKTNEFEAMQLASMGWYVFPCKLDKSPYTPHGMKDATTDTKQVRDWWGRWPNALIGIYCEKSEIFAVDLDVKSGKDGVAAFTELIMQKGGVIPDTPTQATPSGGYHYVLKYPEGVEINNGTDTLAPGIDTRSAGYICTGGSYQWADGFSPFDLEPPEAPVWLIDLAKKPEPQPELPQPILSSFDNPFGPDYWLKRAMEQGHNGNRNTAGKNLVLQLRDTCRLSQNEAESVILQYQRATVDSGDHAYTEREALATLKSIYKRPPREPATVTAAQPVPPAPMPEPPPNFDAQEPTQPQEPKYKLYTAADALEPLPPIDWVIDGLIPEGTVTVVFGDAGSKKTYAAIDAAVCVALGMPWLDFQTAQAPALFVDEEMGARYLSGRLSEALRGHLADENTPIYYTSLAGFDLRQPEAIADLHRLIHKTAARFVVIDAMMDVIPGADENSVKDVAPIIKALKHIADSTKAAIILIHHANKNGGYRGSTAIKGGVDLMLEIKSSQESEIINFETEKPRLIANKRFTARAIWQDGEFYLATSETAADGMKYLGKSQEYVIRFLAANGPSLIDDIMGHADTCSENAARQAIYALVNLQLVQRVDEGGRGMKAVYDLTDNGKKYAESAGFE